MNLMKAFEKTQESNSIYEKASIEFSLDLTYNIKKLNQQLKNKTYETKKYNIFKVYEPKERIIAAPQFKDKVVQFAAHRILNPKFENKFINNSFSCINGKGTHACAKKTHKFLKRANWMWEDPWIIKADIKSYFYSIDHKILKNILKKEIKSKKILNLLSIIIDGSPNKVGLPLGNVTSQLFANVYLNRLDNFIKRNLGIKFFTRYMDDFCIIVRNRKQAKIIKNKLSSFANEKLNLKMNKRKTKIFPLRQGVNFTGYKIWHTHILIRKKSKERMKSKLKKFPKLIKKGDLTKQKAKQMANSWKGHADHACSKNLYDYLLNRFSYLKYEDEKFEIDLQKI